MLQCKHVHIEMQKILEIKKLKHLKRYHLVVEHEPIYPYRKNQAETSIFSTSAAKNYLGWVENVMSQSGGR
jgi:hypothetical protein